MRALALLVALLIASPVEAARGFTIGFELQSATNGVEWGNNNYSGAVPSISTSTFRSGAAALEVTSLSSGARKVLSIPFPGGLAQTSGDSWYIGGWFRYATLPSADNQILGFCQVQTISGCTSPRVYLTNAGKLKLVYDSGGSLVTVGSSTTTLSANTWYCVGLRQKYNSAAADEAELQIGGSTEVSSLSVAFGQPIVWFLGGNGENEAQTTGNWFFDDWAHNDSNGANQAGFPSCTRKIEYLRPNGAGEFAQTTTIVGGDANVWEALDETTPDDGDLSIPAFGTSAQLTANCATWACAAAGSRFMVAVSNMSETPTSVNVVQIGSRFTNDSASGSNFTYGIQTANGGTKVEQATGTLGSGVDTWQTNRFSPSDKNYFLTQYADPDAAAWTVTTLNSLQIGARVTDASPNVWITTMWVLVDYEPPAAAATNAPRCLLVGVC